MRSVSVFLSPPQRQFALTLKKFTLGFIIPLDLKYEQRSPRPRSPSQRFLFAACIYNLALLLIYSDLTQLSELTQHKYTKSLQRRVSSERFMSIFVTQRQECCANEDSDLYNVKNYGSYCRFHVITMIINDFHIFGRNTNTFSFAFPLVN